MEIGIMQESLGTQDALLAIERAGFWGFDAVELITKTTENGLYLPYTSEEKQTIKEALETNGVMLSSICLGSSRDFGFVDFGTMGKERVMQDFVDVIKTADNLGTGIVLVSFFGKNKIRCETDQRLVVEGIKSVMPLAEKHRITLALEMTLDPDTMISMLDEIDSQCVGIYYDVGNMDTGGFDNGDAIRELGGFISAVHIKDRKVGNGNKPLGEGDVDFITVRDALEDIGYNQILTLETPIGDDPEIEARKNLAFVKKIWGL